jgi:hypothetical protein
MAAFTPGVFRRFLARGHTPEVRIFIKLRPDIGMAGLASVAAYEFVFCVSLRKAGWLLR